MPEAKNNLKAGTGAKNGAGEDGNKGAAQLETLRDEILSCKKCGLCKERTQAVPGSGARDAVIMFVGEGPGKNEDEQGVPFVGRAGKFLDEMLASIGLTRADVFVTNVVKCRPPENRDPLPEEVATCWPYLMAQIAALRPRLIVTLGRHAMYRFLPETFKISDIHGQAKKMVNTKTGEAQTYYPIYHPAAALYNPNLRATLMADFKRIPKVLEVLGK